MPMFCAANHRLLTTVSSAETLKCLFYVQVYLSSFKTLFFPDDTEQNAADAVKE